ncbi:MAG: HD domain-containing phosphohydrolase [Candidatus Eisenbacteria bacterium]
MILHDQIPLHRLLLSLSDAMDFAHATVADHQRRVAYLSMRIGKVLGMRGNGLTELFEAALLHDIGLIREENRGKAMAAGGLADVAWHAEVGYRLLKDTPMFAPVAETVRFHHTPYSDSSSDGDPVGISLASYVIAVGDEIDRMIDRGQPILNQVLRVKSAIQSLSGKRLHPDAVDAFLQASESDAFWLDCESERLYSVLTRHADWPVLIIDEQALQPIAEIFSRVTDAASAWTATHSAGVAATAVALAERMHFSPRELDLMRAAGHLHDIGKLTIPTAILDKQGPLTREEMAVIRSHTYHTFHILDTVGGMQQVAEWAAFHHERLDGRGYPFHHRARDLTLGSRIMAVADVFTAVMESRPYRKGNSPARTIAILDDLVAHGALDGDVVTVLRANHEAIDGMRERRQEEYHERQMEFASLAPPALAA